MAQKKSTSRRSSSRSRQGGNGSRPAQQAKRSDNDSDREYRRFVSREESDPAGPPDVLLDVPELRVDSIHFELDDLDAHLAVKANVLDLVKLNVGIDVHLSRVKLDIKGVEVEAVLKARLDHVTAVVDRLMTSLDRNPELVEGLSRAISEVGQGAGEAVDETGDAAKDIGQGAGQAVGDVGQGAGQAVGDVGQGAGQAAGNLDQVVGGAGQTLGQLGQGAGQAAQGATQNGGSDQGQAGGQQDGGIPAGAASGGLAKEVAKTVAREIRHAASDEAREIGLAATRKVRGLAERREHRRADKYNVTETALRVADELGIDLADVEGTGNEGRITVKDVRQAQET